MWRLANYMMLVVCLTVAASCERKEIEHDGLRVETEKEGSLLRILDGLRMIAIVTENDDSYYVSTFSEEGIANTITISKNEERPVSGTGYFHLGDKRIIVEFDNKDGETVKIAGIEVDSRNLIEDVPEFLEW